MVEYKMSDLFEPKMERWGYRADPLLWDRIKYEFRGEPLAAEQVDIERKVIRKFFEITGVDMFNLQNEGDYIKLPEFSRGGLSNGLVSPHFWRDVILPELAVRHRKLMAKG